MSASCWMPVPVAAGERIVVVVGRPVQPGEPGHELVVPRIDDQDIGPMGQPGQFLMLIFQGRPSSRPGSRRGTGGPGSPGSSSRPTIVPTESQPSYGTPRRTRPADDHDRDRVARSRRGGEPARQGRQAMDPGKPDRRGRLGQTEPHDRRAAEEQPPQRRPSRFRHRDRQTIHPERTVPITADRQERQVAGKHRPQQRRSSPGATRRPERAEDIHAVPHQHHGPRRGVRRPRPSNRWRVTSGGWRAVRCIVRGPGSSRTVRRWRS